MAARLRLLLRVDVAVAVVVVVVVAVGLLLRVALRLRLLRLVGCARFLAGARTLSLTHARSLPRILGLR